MNIIDSQEELEVFIDNVFTNFKDVEDISIDKNLEKVVLHLTGDKYNRSITVSAMKYILELQNSINSAYRTFSGRGLSKSDRDKLELTVTVKEGSSLLEVLLSDQLGFLREAIARMTGEQIYGVIISGMVLLSITTIVKKSYDFFDKINREKLDLQKEKARDDKDKFFIEKLVEVSNAQDCSRKNSLRALKNIAEMADLMEINGHELTVEELRERSRKTMKKEKIELEQKLVEGEYKVTDIHIDDEWYSIDVISKDGEVIKNITLLEGMIDQDDYKVIKESANRIFMHMKILLTYKRDIIQCATLNSVEWDK